MIEDPFTQVEQECWERLKPFMSREQFQQVRDQAKAYAQGWRERSRLNN